MDEQEDDLAEVSWLSVLEESGYWIQPIDPLFAKYLEVDASHMGIFYSDPAIPEDQDPPIKLAGAVCFFNGGPHYGRIDAYGHTNLAHLYRIQRKIVREFGLVFQMRLNPRRVLAEFIL